MVKITAPVLGLLSNSEVLQVLHDRGADSKSLSGRATNSERQVYNYLDAHSAGLRSTSSLKQFIEDMKPFNLSQAEVLNIMNICPSQAVEIYLLVDKCEERLTDEQVGQILDIVSRDLKH